MICASASAEILTGKQISKYEGGFSPTSRQKRTLPSLHCIMGSHPVRGSLVGVDVRLSVVGLKENGAAGCDVDGRRPVGLREGCIVGALKDGSNEEVPVGEFVRGPKLGNLVGSAVVAGAPLVGAALGFPGETVGALVSGILATGEALGNVVGFTMTGAVVIGDVLGLPGVIVGIPVGLFVGVWLGG